MIRTLLALPRQSRRSVALMCVALAAVVMLPPRLASGTASPDDPVPNSNCPSDHPGDTGGQTVTGGASGCYPRSIALGIAESRLERTIGGSSGVVCKICPDGQQCYRSVDFDGEPTFTSVPGSGCAFGDFSFTASYNGTFTVKCGACPFD